jgi:hypothetical protein
MHANFVAIQFREKKLKINLFDLESNYYIQRQCKTH